MNTDEEISIVSQLHLRYALEGNVDHVRRCAGVDDEVVFKTILIAVVGNIHAGIHIANNDSLICRHMRYPLIGCSIKIVCFAREPARTANGCVEIATPNLHF